MNAFLNVVSKEWRDASRDRRSVMASLLFAAFGPLMIYLLLGSLADEMDESGDLQVAIIGAEQAPALLTRLTEQGVVFEQFASRAEAADSSAEVLVKIPDDYRDRYLSNTPIDIAVTADFKDGKAEAGARRVTTLINGFGQTVAYSRMVAAGVLPGSLNVVRAQSYDSSLAGGRAAAISDTLIYMLLLSGFISGAFMAADSVAGERERHSLESLLAQPVSPLSIVGGKWLTAGGISVFVSIATAVISGVLLAKAPLDVLGLRLFIDPASIALGALILVPLALLAVAIQMFVAARARTYREAGTYAQFTMFIPIAVAGSVMIGSVDYGAVGEWLPLTSQTIALKDVLLEGGSSARALLGGSLTTLLAAWALVWLTSKRLSDERAL
ncbi:MAG: ABC transporter permease subunit [Pseudomonadota bacterium]